MAKHTATPVTLVALEQSWPVRELAPANAVVGLINNVPKAQFVWDGAAKSVYVLCSTRRCVVQMARHMSTPVMPVATTPNPNAKELVLAVQRAKRTPIASLASAVTQDIANHVSVQRTSSLFAEPTGRPTPTPVWLNAIV